MKKKQSDQQNLSEEELKKLNDIQESKEDEKGEILFRTSEEDKKKKKEIDQKKEEEKTDLFKDGNVLYKKRRSFNSILLKSAVFRDVTFIEPYYDHLYRMTGLKKDEKNPHYRPNIFAELTIKYIYRRFNIKNLMDELQSRNPFITAESMREFKHYQFLNEENYLNLLGFIDDFIKFADKTQTPLHKFDVDYCKKYNLTTDGDMFYND